MKTIADLMTELAKSVELYKFYERQSSYYTLERVDELCEEIKRLSHEKRIIHKVNKLRKDAYAYSPSPSELELSCMAASRVMRDPDSSKILL